MEWTDNLFGPDARLDWRSDTGSLVRSVPEILRVASGNDLDRFPTDGVESGAAELRDGGGSR